MLFGGWERQARSKLTGASTPLLGRSSLRLASGLVRACSLALLVLLVLVLPIERTSANSEENFYQFLRPKLGYFARYSPTSPYARIYEEYFANVVRKNDKAMESLPTDDWRKVRPTGELCVDFLVGLKVKSYIMSKPYELIILDACLDWLFEQTDPVRADERKNDVGRLDSSRKMSLKSLTSDARLRQIYEGTRFSEERQVPQKLQDDIYAYLVRLLNVYSENPRNGCHSLWLEAYNDFIDDVYVADCEDETKCRFFGVDNSHSDSYLAMVLESTRAASKTCYSVMQKQIRGLIESEFERSNSGASSLKTRFKSKTNKVLRQSESEKWAREMISILQMASGVDQDTPVNLGDVVRDLYKIKNGDQELIERFTKALGEFATANGDLRDSSNDQYGRARFGRAMIKLCRPYTDKRKFLSMTGGINMDDDESERKPFEFYGLIYSLVRLTNHESIFDITKDNFEEDVIKNHWEALYLATFACQFISTTWGELDYEQNTQAFNVLLRPEWTVMIADWPIELMTERLPSLYPKSASRSSGAPGARPESAAQPAAYFGKKFKLNFRSGGASLAAGQEAQAPNLVAAPQSEPAPAPAPAPAEPARYLPVMNNPSPPTSTPEPATPAPVAPTTPPPVSSLLSAAQEPKIMSWETIEMYRKLHGRYPQLPDYYKKIYPQLPDDLGGRYTKELGLAKRPVMTTTLTTAAATTTTTKTFTSTETPSYLSEGRFASSYGGAKKKPRDAFKGLSGLNF